MRAAGQVVITNPDMLHAAILPHHTKWFKLFENLRYVVIDELHTYRGLFGSHVANVIRRLRRICAHYGADPVFICASATIANPRELAERVLEAPVELIDDNGAPSGRRHILVVNPPVANEQLGIRGSSLLTGAAPGGAADRRRRADDRLRALADRGRGAHQLPARDVRARRRAIRTRSAATAAATCRTSATPSRPGLRDGRVRGVVATNALELGIDIGSLDAAISVGYPGTIAIDLAADGPRRPAQRARASRRWSARRRRSTSSWPLTRSTSSTQSPEHGLVNPDNLHVLLNHLRASSFELPVPAAERFGLEETPMLLDVLEEDGYLRRADDDRYYWSHDNFPASDFSLRTGAPENVVIVDTTGDRHRVLGEVDLFAAPLLVHEKAIYIHAGRAAPRRPARLGRAQGVRHAHRTSTTTPMRTSASR